jgi:hypothetical protein
MSYSEEKFREHIRKIIEKSQVDTNRPLTLDELKELALSMGLSDSEWEATLVKANQSLGLAKKHLAVKNFMNAVESAEEATTINPYVKEGNAILSQAYYQLSVLEKNDRYLLKAGDFARRELILDPKNTNALNVLSAVENQISEGRYSKKLFNYLGFGGVILLLLFFAFSYCNKRTTENDVPDILQKKTEANADSRAKKLHNLVFEKERIYKEAVQRRNEFLLSWFSSENTSTSNAGIDAIEDFDFNNLSKSEMSVKRALGAMKSEKILSLDEETRLEGLENRMAVEKKRWFEAIAAYNTQIQTYPSEKKRLSQIDFPD